MTAVELTHPLFLLGLLALPVLVWYFFRGLTDFARWQRILSLSARTIVVVLLVLALAGLTWLRSTKEQFVVFAIDESLSVGDDAKKEVDAFLDKVLPSAGPNRVAFLRFAAEPGPVLGDRTKTAPLKREGTNIAAALEVATATIPPSYVPKVVLLTDGNQTSGDALKAALHGRVPVSTVPLPTRNEPEVQVTDVQLPAQVREGEPFYVEVVIDSNHDDEGQVQVFRGAHKVVDDKVKIKKGENHFRFRQSIVGERLAEYTVTIKGFQDKLQDNNTAKGLVFSSGKPRILLIESDPKLAKHLGWALEQEGIVVDTRPTQGMPDSLSDLQNYELLILSNVPATALSQRQMDVARTYVQDLGGGLIMIGGDQAFGLGGYYKTVIEEILPVRSDFEKEKEKPSLAMVIVIDKSGSMGGLKMEMTKDASKGAIELLGPKDKIGVILFEGETFVLQDMTSGVNKAAVIDKIAGIEAGGGTVMEPAMQQALEMLQNTVAKLKHVIILTDGISSPGDFEGIAQQMAQAKITLSTVGVGDDADNKLLENLAKIGNGRHYATEDPSNIPQIFAKETVTASKAAINEQPFIPQVLRPTQVLADIDFANAPFLLGYVTTRPKPTSELILVSEKGDPLLAWWRYGLGMTVAFTSDAKSRWAAEWVSWPGYSKFWAQVVRHAMRKGDAKGVFVQVAQKDKKATLTLDAVKMTEKGGGSFLNNADTEIKVIDPQGGEKVVVTTQTAPGRYVGDFETPKTGTYHLQVMQKQNGIVVNQQSRGLVVNYDDELRLRPTDEKLLEAIASVSGGTYKPDAGAIFNPPERTASRAVPLWPYLLIAALLIFLADVALRRIDFNLMFSRMRRLPGVPAPARATARASVNGQPAAERKPVRT
jgi:Ca-activated chloride channel homolog